MDIRSQSIMRRKQRKTSPYNFAYFVLNHKRDILYDRINRRVDIMVEQGLIDEVKRLKEEGYEKTMVSMRNRVSSGV